MGPLFYFLWFSDVKFTDYKFDYCVIGVTPTNQLYIDMVAPGLGIALGGCGWAAKSSDEAGQIAARWGYSSHLALDKKWK